MSPSPFDSDVSISDITSSNTSDIGTSSPFESDITIGDYYDLEAEAEQDSVNKLAAEIARDAIASGKDADYDYTSALEYQNRTGQSLYDPETGHWSSRVPDTGLLLKSPTHETAGLMYEGESAAGYAIERRGNREYSVEASRINGGRTLTDKDRAEMLEGTRARLAGGESMTDQ